MHQKRNHGILLFFSTLGAAIAIYLIYHHIHIMSGGHGGFLCSAGELFDCESVAYSSYSEILGFPVASFGLAFYLGVILLSVIALNSSHIRRASSTLGFIFSFLAVIAAIIYTSISFLVIDALCLWCLISHGITAIIFIFYAALFVKEKENPFALLVSLLQKKEPFQHAPGNQILISILILFAVTSVGVRIIGASMANNSLSSEPIDTSRLIARFENLPELSIPTDERPSKGNPQAPVTVVEFSDFQCPSCKMAHRELKPFIKRNQNSVHFVYRHFPLDMGCNNLVSRPVHPFACEAALGSVCAGFQEGDDAFFRFHDLLFANQASINSQMIRNIASDMGLDAEAFQECMESDKAMAVVQEDIRLGEELAIQATPTLIINGRKMTGALSREELESLKDHLLNEIE